MELLTEAQVEAQVSEGSLVLVVEAVQHQYS
jgi:hypothetical protein